MEVANQFLIPVTENSQVGEARRRAARLAESVGFDEVAAGRVSIVTTELATNLVKHTTSGGNLIIQLSDDESIEVLSLNKSPGMQNPERWLADGYSTANTLGTGLGAVRRLSNKFDLYSDTTSGTAILASLSRQSSEAQYFDIGAVNLPKENEPVCGDSWCSAQNGSKVAIVLADGLGHGIEAFEASQAAIKIFRANPFAEPAALLEMMHRGLKGTRGAAVSILQADLNAEKVLFAGLGNVVGIIDSDVKRKHLVPDNGTVGYEVRKFRQSEFEWQRGVVITMHSDGLSSSWNLNSYENIRRKSAGLIAGVLYRDFSKKHDDCTVVVLKTAPR